MNAPDQRPGKDELRGDGLRGETRELLSLYCDGTATPAQVERLELLLEATPSGSRLLLDYLQLDADLRFAVQEQRALNRSLSAIRATSSATPAGANSAVSPSPLIGEGRGEGSSAAPTISVAPPTKSPVLGFLGGVVDYVSHSRTLMFWLIGGSLGLYFAVQFGSLMVSRFWEQRAAQVAEDHRAGTEKHDQLVGRPGLGTPSGEKIVARLTNAVDCQWTFSRPDGTNRIDQPEWVALDVGTELHAGQKLNLTAGLAELTFDSGAKVVLTAPARFDLTDALGGDLQRGKLTAKVPHTASGFTIATPGGKVVDLGTEFGVKVNDDGVMNVIVYVGEVKVEPGAGVVGSTDQPGGVRLQAGQAVTVGPDKTVRPIPAENEHFVRDLAPLGDKSKAEAAYVEFVKSLKPAVWFRMEGKDTDRALHDEMGGRDANLSWDGPGNPFVKGPIGKSLWLRGPQLRDFALAPDYPKAEHGKLTVTAWAYADSSPPWAMIAANWGDSVYGQFHFGLCGAGGGTGEDLSVQICQASGSYTLLREGASHPFSLYEWQHVAFTMDGTMLRLYRQGREVGAMKVAGLRFPSPLKQLAIGAKTDNSGTAISAPAPGVWSGKLDEIAVFNDALSAEDIKKLAGAAPR